MTPRLPLTGRCCVCSTPLPIAPNSSGLCSPCLLRSLLRDSATVAAVLGLVVFYFGAL